MIRLVVLLLVLLAALTTAGYAFYAAIQMGKALGTDHYWFSPWWYKAHAALFALMALWVVADWLSLKKEQ